MILATSDPKRRRLRQVFGGLAVSLALGAPFGAASAADPSEFSEAEKLVFVEPQLANIESPTSLRYGYVKSGSLEPGFEDQVVIDISKIDSTGSTVNGSFLSGSRKVELPEINGARANPVILYFLERDIHEMERLTKGKANHFRTQIRKAMVDQAVVRDIRIDYNGNKVDAKEVALSPYLTDPLRPRFEKYAQKRYTFVLSKAVPGGVYQIRTAMAGAQASDAPILEEVMTLAAPVTRHSVASPETLNQTVKSR